MSITNTTQLSLFSLIRAAILANATLSVKFNNSNIYQFEPKNKDPKTSFPYIVINIPSNPDQEFLTLDHSLTDKSFDVELLLKMDYMARDNFLAYGNAMIKAIESYESTFDSSGYFNAQIKMMSALPTVEDQKELIIGTFVLSFNGMVDR